MTATTLRIAEDLADRMDYTTGHVRFCILDMVDRLGISEATIYRHVGYLRELGALAWAVHGSHANSQAPQGLEGYAPTATVYAAVIPAVYDHAMGHRIIGNGYTARIIVDLRKRPTVPSQRASEPVDNSSQGAVENSGPEPLETPSLMVVKKVGQVQEVGGCTTTAQRQRNDSTPNQTRRNSGSKRATILGAAVTAAGMQLGDKLARAIRRRVPWARKVTHDQLRWVCADMGEQQWTEDQAVRFVVEAGHQHGAGFAWHPARPHRLIAAELLADQDRQAEDAQHRADLAVAIPWEQSTAYREQQAARASLEALFRKPHPEPQPKHEYTAEERARARMDWNAWPEVLDHLADDQDDAIALYGPALCKYAISQQARLGSTEYAHI
ncbi:hypothetical protein [Streptomyces sp. NPDC008092]|uniref:hypothetical protein n=1 Tax=Streptomyces sp. NPDC008092 TaxID=3364808 RepID=UPI0036E9EF8D